MPLKSFYEKLEDIPEGLRDHYAKTDDGYVLDVDGADYRQKLGEFRGNNINLMKERDDLLKQLTPFKDIDPAKYAEMKKKLNDLDEKGLLEAGKIDELVEKRVAKMRSDFEGQINQLTTNADEATQRASTYKTQLDKLAINDAISKAASDVGKLRKGALTDVLARAHRDWRVNENGVPVAMNGDTLVYGKDGKAPLTAGEWAQGLAQDAPYLFEGNTGGGAGGSGSGTGGRRTITREEYRTGKYVDQVAKGEIDVVD